MFDDEALAERVEGQISSMLRWNAVRRKVGPTGKGGFDAGSEPCTALWLYFTPHADVSVGLLSQVGLTCEWLVTGIVGYP